MECSITTLLTLFVALLAVLATLLSVRYQIITLINHQLSDKARECNGNLSKHGEVQMDQLDKVTGIVSSIISARQILNLHLKSKKHTILIWVRKDRLVDGFYLQLHTSVRTWIKKNELKPDEFRHGTPASDYIKQQNDKIVDQIIGQFVEVRKFLAGSICRDEQGFFE